MQLIDSHNLFHRLDIDRTQFTAVDTGISASGPGIAKLRQNLTGGAMLIRRDTDGRSMTATVVPIYQILALDSRVHIVLSGYFSGHTLSDYLGQRDTFSREKADFFSLLFLMFRENLDLLPERVNPQHILYCDDASILLIPEQWSRVLSSYETERSLSKGYRVINYPDPDMFEKPRIVQFYLACALEYVLTRVWPYAFLEPHHLSRMQRKMLAVPLELIDPGLPDEISDWIDAALVMEAENPPEAIDTILQRLADEPPAVHPDRDPSIYADTDRRAADRRAVADRRAASDNPQIRRYRTRMKQVQAVNWIRRHSVAVTAITLSAIVFIAAGITVIQNFTRDLMITGLSPAEVVAGFYDSYNNLGHEFMSEATADDAARSEIRRIIHIYAVSVVREGTEMQSVFIPAPVWLDLDEETRPPLERNLVFGLTDLELSEQRRFTDAEGRPSIEFAAEYTIWDPAAQENTLIPSRRRDELLLREFRRGWKIVEFESEEL